jgi:flavin reductase (DIM6/NTAB) family NADH-FMN oxidoreductase RutF
MPTTIVGALVDGKPNYATIAHVGIMELTTISLGMNKNHYTNQGIKENNTFSVNIPSENIVKETDYCGLVSGENKDKAALFKTFFGALRTAPMIEQCAINMECELVKTVDFSNHDVFIGRIVETYCDEKTLSDGVVDLRKLQPLLFAMNDRSYWGIGHKIANAWNAGKELMT